MSSSYRTRKLSDTVYLKEAGEAAFLFMFSKQRVFLLLLLLVPACKESPVSKDKGVKINAADTAAVAVPELSRSNIGSMGLTAVSNDTDSSLVADLDKAILDCFVQPGSATSEDIACFNSALDSAQVLIKSCYEILNHNLRKEDRTALKQAQEAWQL